MVGSCRPLWTHLPAHHRRSQSAGTRVNPRYMDVPALCAVRVRVALRKRMGPAWSASDIECTPCAKDVCLHTGPGLVGVGTVTPCWGQCGRTPQGQLC